MKVVDSFGNGYGISLGDVITKTEAAYQGDVHNANADLPMAKAGTFKNLTVKAQTFTLNDDLKLTLFVNGSPTDVEVTITSTGVVSNNVDTVSVSAGDEVSLGTDCQNASSGNYKLVGTIEFAEA